jgi:hypothetical protein
VALSLTVAIVVIRTPQIPPNAATRLRAALELAG